MGLKSLNFIKAGLVAPLEISLMFLSLLLIRSCLVRMWKQGAAPQVCPGIEGVTSSPGFEMGNQGGSTSSVAFHYSISDRRSNGRNLQL